MADFYPVLSRAIAGLSDPSPEMRRAIYDRARSVLVAQLRGLDPPLSETDIARERLGLDETIARLEAELLGRVAGAGDAAGSRVVSSSEAAGSRGMSSGETASGRAIGSGETASGRATAPVSMPEKPVPSVPSAEFTVPDARSGLPLREPEVTADQAANKDVPEKSGSALPVAPSQISTHPLPVDLLPTDTQLGERPRIGPPPSKERNPGRIRTLLVAGVVAMVVAGIAALAYRSNVIDAAAPPVRQPQDTPAGTVTQNDSGPKINERIGADGAPAGGSSPVAPGTATSPRAEVGIAQRAVLYIETAENPQQPRTVQGRAVWRLDSENVGVGQPVETVVTAKIDIPDAGLSLLFSVRRNTDAAFPASHIVGLRFSRSFDDGNGTVREAGVPQFKSDESERGAPLSAITSALGENLFVSALSNVPVEIERNLDVMTKRSWIDIPVRFASGRRGIIAFEKGLSGDQALAEAFNAWR